MKNFNGFSKLNREERLAALLQGGFIEQTDYHTIKSAEMQDISLAEKFIENAIGFYSLPLGIAVNFVIDGKPYVIPMAIEETSVIAAASKTAKWIATQGRIETAALSKLTTGQIQLSKVSNFSKFKRVILKHKQALIVDANTNVAMSMVNRGGGLKDLHVRRIKRPDKTDMAVIHLLVDTCDAMGANIVNQICEYLKPSIEQLTHEKVTMCILSNLCDQKITQAKITLEEVEPHVAEAIVEASLFAELDPYRAATNNKGVLNAIDGIVIATGNDWRAIEAGIHAYAARDGHYRSITQWTLDEEGRLIGILEVPLNVGIVGGVTSLHPFAKLNLKMLNVSSADELARVIAAVGLTQNLGAIRALTSEGITRGHMSLHIDNFCCAVDATNEEIFLLKEELKNKLTQTKFITHSDVNELLQKIRSNEASNDGVINDDEFKKQM